jgi:hypothetical protein
MKNGLRIRHHPALTAYLSDTPYSAGIRVLGIWTFLLNLGKPGFQRPAKLVSGRVKSIFRWSEN